MPYLRYTTPTGGTQWVSLHGLTVIGRSQECDLVLEDTNASRRHAEVRKVQADYVIKDLKSKNGTFVNGSQISTWTLKEGDLISIGNAQMVYRNSK